MTKNRFHSSNGPPGTTSTFERRSSRAAQIILENIYGLLPAVSFPSAGSAIVIVLSSEKRLTLIDGEVSRTAGSTVYTAILPRIKAEWFFLLSRSPLPPSSRQHSTRTRNRVELRTLYRDVDRVSLLYSKI